MENESLENSEQPAENCMRNDNPDAEVRGGPHKGIKKETSQSSSSRQYPKEQVFKPKHSWDQPENQSLRSLTPTFVLHSKHQPKLI
eukprot:9125688-Karenia_brevis.AAC.1